MSEISVQCKYMLRVNIRIPLKVIFGTKNIIGGMFRLSTQYISQLLTVLNQKLNKTVILTCPCSICIENESTGKYTCSHAPYTRFTSVKKLNPSRAFRLIRPMLIPGFNWVNWSNLDKVSGLRTHAMARARTHDPVFSRPVLWLLGHGSLVSQR